MLINLAAIKQNGAAIKYAPKVSEKGAGRGEGDGAVMAQLSGGTVLIQCVDPFCALTEGEAERSRVHASCAEALPFESSALCLG